jgi:ATPase subunit of ABC transporter with duplicated ATPase domains
VVHDRYFIEQVATHIWLMENKSVREIYELEKEEA